MINQTGSFLQFPGNVLQSGTQQNGQLPQGNQIKPAITNKPQQNRSAEAATSHHTNRQSETDYKALAESIIAKRKEQADSFRPVAERGSIINLTV